MNLSLFNDMGPRRGAGGPRSPLAAKLRTLASEGVYLGTSSWKYEGWLGSIYTPERYTTRGRFSRKKFEAECLAEYVETFPIVCGDFSFYQFPSPDYWHRLFTSAPRALQFGFKVPEEITVKTWPSHARYGARGGRANENFLDPKLFELAFLRPLEEYRERAAVLIFEFGTFSKREYESSEPFTEELQRFLAALPEGWRYAVEIRNREYLAPGYFDALRRRNVAHVFNSWTRMPDLSTQTAIADAYTADFVVARGLLKPGRSFEDAVKKFQPYREVQEPNAGVRDALRRLIERARNRANKAFVFLNNRLEGNAPGTIEAVVGEEA